MRTRLILPGAAAILCAGALTSAQIAPQGGVQQRAPRPTTQQPRPSPNEGPMTTLAGCLYREDSIPGRSPNVAEKAGVGEDYILADAITAREQNRTPDRPIADAGPEAPRPDQADDVRVGKPDQPRPSQGATTGLAAGRMYKVTQIDDAKLKELVGKRVEVTGTVKADNESHAGNRDGDAQHLPNIEGTAIREVAGQACPARPAAAATPAPNR